MRLPKHRPPTHPGEMLLEEFLKPMHLTQVAAAERMAVPLTRLNEIVRGKRGVSADTAWSLSELLGTTPQFWMNLQVAWDLWHAREARQRAGRTRKAVRRVSGRTRHAAGRTV